MNDLFLGVIAVAVLVMAVIQVTALVVAARAARRVGDLVTRFEQDVKPIVANLQVMTAEAARVSASAATQVTRVEHLVNDLARIAGETAGVLSTFVRPARDGFAVIQGILAALAVFRQAQGREPGRSRPGPVDEEDALFIG